MECKEPAIIVDLDGTLYNAKDRQEKFLLSGKKDFDGFHKAAHLDFPHAWCAEIVQAMRNKGFRIIFTSGRDNTYQPETEKWLRNHLNLSPGQYDLHMRPANDPNPAVRYQPDDEMKKAWYINYIQPNYDILFCIDDRKRVADMWRSVGLTCLHCAEGNF